MVTLKHVDDKFFRSCGTGELLLIVYIVLYFIVNLTFLTEFPFVHSDESWLSGLTRNMMQSGRLDVTETFFDLKPRYPHAIKVVFHLIQMSFLSFLPYEVFTFRLISLIFSCIALILFYIVLKTIFGSDTFYPLLGTFLLSVDIQFIYASHFARQEILLLCCIISCILFVLKYNYRAAAIITGLSIGLHPNSFLISTMCAAMLLPAGEKVCCDLAERKWPRITESFRPLIIYTCVTSLFAAFFVAVSLSFDEMFFAHYMAYGNSEFDIGAPVTSKLMELPIFFAKIWHQVSGTYYVPDIRLEFFLFAAVLFLQATLYIYKKTRFKTQGGQSAAVVHRCASVIPLMLRGTGGMLLGMVIIGRYNQTGIIFLFPLLFIVLLLSVNSLGKSGQRAPASAVSIALAMTLCCSSVLQITPWLRFDYDDYTREISGFVSPDDKVLANLNSEFYFDNGCLLDYRNLSFLTDNDMSVEEYVDENGIEYVILSDEMDFIYSQRPIWNMIYGNLRYMPELRRYLDENAAPVHSFTDNTYAIRIVQYIDSGRDFTVTIYKIAAD